MRGIFTALSHRALALLVAAGCILIVGSSPTTVRAQEASAKATAAAALAGTLSERGRVRVIVRLRGDFRPEYQLAGPEGIETSAAVAAQRAMIGQAQSRVMSDLAGADVQSVKRFQFSPHMGMSVDGPGLDALVDSPDVISIFEDRPQPPSLFQSVPLIGGNVSTGFPLGPDNFTGAGQAVAILDTGVYSGHPFVSGKVVSEACYSTNDPDFAVSSVCPGGVAESTAPGSGGPCLLSIDGCDHGTHVAGIAAGKTTDISGTLFAGVAKDATILAIQVFSRFDDDVSNGFICSAIGLSSPCALTYLSDQISGLERVYALRTTFSIAAANMSLGGGFYGGYCDTDPRKPVIDLLRASGIATVVASGNSGFENGVGSPACISSAVTVGSSTKTDEVSFFSNNSFMVDLLAPGSSIGSSIPFVGYDVWDGTSMAAPHVAGAFAVLKSNKPAASVNDLESALRSTGTPLSETRLGVFFSKPRINVALALAFVPGASTDDVAADFDADSMSDILFRNPGDGRAAIWQMNGLTRESSGFIGTPSLAWRIEDLGDSNGDGSSDILWRNTATDALAIWMMDGFTKLESGQIGSVGTVWRVSGLSDFDGDDRIDILWHNNSTGMAVIWMMDEYVKLSSQSIGGPPISWQIVGLGDFNGDGMTDILWQNSDSSLIVWQMNGFTKEASVAIGTPGVGWSVEGVGDFDGGGQPDILFRNAVTDKLVVWQMNGYSKEAAGEIGAADSSWKVVRIGDHDGSGQADILWNRPGSAEVVIWQMNGFIRQASALIGAPVGWLAQ